MKAFEIVRNYFRLYTIRKDEVIATCLKSNIALTDKNIEEVRSILRHKTRHTATTTTDHL